jgi:hypothetical protein
MDGICRLCKENRSLKSSHLLPKGVYRLLRDNPNINPIVTSKGRSRESSEQVTQHLLCGSCEGKFSKYGEDHVLRYCWREGKGFKLRDSLSSENCIARNDDVSAHYLNEIAYVKVDHFVYFALSMIWRMAATNWRDSSGAFKGTSLGKYEEAVRLYLLDRSVFPEHVGIFLHISSEAMPDNIATTPAMDRINGLIRHKFYIPGLLFVVFVGKGYSAKSKITSLNSNGVAYLCPFGKDGLSRTVAIACQNAKQVGKLQSEGGMSR